MGLNKIESSQLGNFGKLTSAGHAKTGNSIFGDNACHRVCSYEDSFNDISYKDDGAFDIFSSKGKANIEKEMQIMKNEDKPQTPQKSFAMNAKSLLILQQELGYQKTEKSVTLSSYT